MSQTELLQSQQDLAAIPEIPAPVTLTERAAEMVKQAMAQENLDGHGLRVGVVGGGCSGLQYLLDFTDKPGADDFINKQFGIAIYIDPYSASHLQGTTVDYVDSLQGSGFKFENPTATRSCGCGSSFQS